MSNAMPPLPMLYSLSAEVNRVSTYIYPITIALTIITNTMNILVLSRRSLRASPCTQYFLALSIDSLAYIIFTPMNIFLSSAFGLSINYSPFGCRVLVFFVNSSSLFFTSMLVCASIDRFLTSSSSARLRNLSNVRIAQRVIVIVALSILIYMSPFLFIYYWNYTTNQCLQYSTTLTTIYLSSRIVIYSIIGPTAMAVFGLLTINNIRNQTHRAAPFAPPNRHRRTEGQLTRVLIIQVGAHLIFTLPNAVTYVITTFIPSITTPTTSGMRLMSLIWQQGTHFLSLFFYILSATVFRKEFKKMFNLHNGRVHAFNLSQRQTAAVNTIKT